MFFNCANAEIEFEKCWGNSLYTQIELNDVDINQVLKFYHTNTSLNFTKKMLWDMEKKKAWDPEKYIPYVIKKGSGKSLAKSSLENGDVIFVRSSMQKQWLCPEIYEQVFEEVYVNSQKELITFLGVNALPGTENILCPTQPLFHVQHAASGSEARPINKWRIVHLTPFKDLNLIKLFEKKNDPRKLPGFIEEYIREDLGVVLEQTSVARHRL